MDIEKPVKVVLNDAATLIETAEAVDVKNDVCVHCLPQERGLINSIKKEKAEY
jgi:hypothetical protein